MPKPLQCSAVGAWSFERSMRLGAPSYGHAYDEFPCLNGNKVDRFEVRPGDCSRSNDGEWDDCANDRERVELKQLITNEDRLNAEFWYSWSICVPWFDYKNIWPTKVCLGQFYQDFTAENEPRNPREKGPAFMFENASGGLRVERLMRGECVQRCPLIEEFELYDSWHTFVVHARWSRGKDGFFRLWRKGLDAEGSPRYKYEGPTLIADRAIFKYGIYRSKLSENPVMSKRETQVVYFSNVARANNASELRSLCGVDTP